MRAFARRFALLCLIFISAFALLHTPPVKRAVSRGALALLERFLGGAAEFQSFDYRLWRGEFRIEGLSWTNAGMDVRAREVLVLVSLRGPVEVRVVEPHIQMAVSGSAEAGELTLPSPLLETRLAIESGAVRIEWPEEGRTLKLTAIEGSLDPESVFSRATLEAAAGRFRDGTMDVPFGPARARLRLESSQIHIDEGYLAKDGSSVTATGRLGPFSPLAAEIRFEHSIEGALQGLEGLIEGEGELRRRPGALDEGEGVLRTRALSVESIGPFAGEARWRLAGEGASADVSFESLDSARFPSISSRVSGRLELSAVSLDVESVSGEGVISLRGREGLPGIPLDGSVDVRWEGNELSFSAERLVIPGAEIAVSGRLGETVDARYRARIRDIADFLSFLKGVKGPLDVEGTIAGPLLSPAVEGTIASHAIGMGASTFALSGRGAFRGDRVEVHELTLRGPDKGSLVANGAVPTSARGGDFALDVEVEDLPLEGVAEPLSAGTLDASLDVTGPLSQPELEGSLSGKGLTTRNGFRADIHGELRSKGLEGALGVQVENASFRERAVPGARVSVESKGSTARLSARLEDGAELLSAELGLAPPYPLDAEVRLENLPFGAIRDVFPALAEAGLELEVAGRAGLSTSLAQIEDLHYRLEVQRVLARYRGIVLGATSPFVIEGTREGFSVNDLTLVGEDTAIGIDGVVPLSRDGSVFLHARGATRLELVRPWFPEQEPSGRANVDVRVEGALPDPWLRGELAIEEASGRLGGILAENVEAELDWSDRGLTLQRLTGQTLGGAFRVSGELPPQLDSVAPVELRFEISDVEPLRLEEGHLRIGAEGELRGTGTDLARWRGGGSLRGARLEMRGLEIANEAPGTWSLSEGKLSLSDLRMTRGETRLVLEGEGEPFGDPLSWTARASGRIDHEISRIFLTELGLTLTGVTEFSVAAEKQGTEPLTLSGGGKFANARLLVRDPPIAFTNVSGEIALSGSAVSLTRLSADTGGGKVEAEGSLAFEGASLRDVDFRARARAVRLNYPEGVRSEVNGDLRLRGAPDRLRLTGDVDLTRGLLSRDISVESELLQSLSRVSAAAAPSSFASNVELDLRVRAAESFRVDNNLARMDASANLTVSGTLDSPELSGAASVRPGGRFRFGGNVYRVETGRILLRRYPASPPELDITARTSVGEYDIRLVLRGSTDNLSTELSSESHPELSRGDVASLLITGRTLSEISSESRDVVAGRMVSYVGSTLADLAKLGVGEALPFEILTVEPSLIAGETDPGARFTIGARFENALSLVYSVGLDDAESQIWVLDYELPRRTRAQVVRDEQNEYAFGLAQEVRFDIRHRARGDETREEIADVLIAMEGAAADMFEDELRRRLGTSPGDAFDYWKTWEKAEKLRQELRSRGYLESSVDVATTPREKGGVQVEFRIGVGAKVRFAFLADEPDGSLKRALERAWTGDAGDSFLTADLANLATGRLFEDGYFTANAEVATERSEGELVVNVLLTRGPKGKKVVVDFTGNERLSDPALLASLPKPRSAAFHELLTTKRARLKQIVALQYASSGFVSASIGEPETAFDAEREEYRVTIPLVEGPPSLVGTIELEGVPPEDEAELRSKLSLRAGAPFRVQSFSEDRAAIAAFYRERGFVEAEVEATILEQGETPEIGVRFVVKPGPRVMVADVEVRGNDATRESVIRRELKLTPGAPLSASALRETEKGLYELGVFQSAEVVVDEPKEAQVEEVSSRGVRIAVVETQDLELDYGGRASTDGFFEVLTELRAPNLFGRAQHAGFRALVGSERKIFRFSYHSPYFSRYRLDTDFFVERSIEMTGEAPLDVTDRTWTFTAQQTRPLTEKINAQWSYTYSQSAIELGEGIGFESPPSKRSILTGSVIGDQRDNLLRPRRGSLWLLTGQAAPEILGSDLKYTKFFGQLFTYVPLGEDVVWASGYRVGVANSFGERFDEKDGFRAGGPNSVRAFEQDFLGPEDFRGPKGGGGLVVLNQEIRFPLLWRLRGVGFWDSGNAFEAASDIRLSELRQSVGAGLRLEFPFGVLRLDWAAVVNPRPGEKPWRLLFSLGDAF